MAYTTCTRCGQENADGAKFCVKCGSPVAAVLETVPQAASTCPKCGMANEPTAKFCVKCGSIMPVKQKDAVQQATSEKLRASIPTSNGAAGGAAQPGSAGAAGAGFAAGSFNAGSAQAAATNFANQASETFSGARQRAEEMAKKMTSADVEGQSLRESFNAASVNVEDAKAVVQAFAFYSKNGVPELNYSNGERVMGEVVDEFVDEGEEIEVEQREKRNYGGKYAMTLSEDFIPTPDKLRAGEKANAQQFEARHRVKRDIINSNTPQ